MDHQLDFSKLYCQLHPYEMITNYCNDQKCLVGLCATCICSHTEMHAQMGTVPHYQNIRDTFCTLHDEVRNMVSKLEQDKCRLGSVRQSTEIKKITVRKTIRQLRQDALNKIREEFDMLEKKIIADISSEQKKQGYHSNIRFQTLEKNLSRQTETLLSYIEGLNSPNFLEWTKKLKRQALLEANQSRLKIEKQLSDNETYTANLKWNQNFLMDLETCIKKMFTIQFIVPNKGCEVKTIIPVLRQSNININMLQRSTSQPKLSQSFIRNNSSLVGLSKFAESTSMSTFFNESDKPLQMQKQSFMRKNNSIVSPSSSSVSDCEVLASKENYLARSSMINEQMQFLNRSSMMNSSMAFTKPSFQNDKLANLLELKKSTQFDSGRNSALIREENILKDTNIHQN